ncbi:MAG: rhodanese-like domain-containing protein [Bacteriovoracaceae bacterium]
MHKILESLETMNARLANIETNLARIEEKSDLSLAIQRNHLIRIKNGEELSDEMVLMGRPYNDLSPEKAFRIYQNPDVDFMVLDVCEKGYTPFKNLESVVKIPISDFAVRIAEIKSKTTPILVISEDGVNSIHACEMLIKRGFFNINNVSGGYKFWPEFRLKEISKSA